MFACAACRCPLQVHDAFRHPDEHTRAELNLPAFPASDYRQPSAEEAVEGGIDRSVCEASLQGGSEGLSHAGVYADLCDVTAREPSVAWTQHGYAVRQGARRQPSRVTAELFEVASACSSVDHPLCEECVGALLEEKAKIKADELEKLKLCEELLKELENPEDDIDEEYKKEALALAAVEAEVEALLREQRAVAAALADRRAQNLALETESERYLLERAKNRVVADALDLERICLHQLGYDCQCALGRLKRESVLHRAFTIWSTGHLATINGLRLGRTATVQTPWVEINTALGYVAALVAALGRELGVTLQRYRPVPLGPHSYVRCSVPGKEADLKLYTNSPMHAFMDSGFDQALCGLLDCFCQLVAGRAVQYPYPVRDGKLEDLQEGQAYTIKLQFNNVERWSKALKFFLTNLKWLITYASLPHKADDQSAPSPHSSPALQRIQAPPPSAAGR